MNATQLNQAAKVLVAPGKGVLAADESLPTIGKRFKNIGIDNTEPNRRAYRQMLFSTPGLGDFIGGVILFDETIRQRTDDGTPLPELLRKQKILPGIKVDAGTKALEGFPGEKITLGLDGLAERLAAYRELGAAFTKWRAVIAIGPDFPTPTGIAANAQALARFAAESQAQGLVPIVEPEVLMDGDHSLERSRFVTEWALREVFYQLGCYRVDLEGILLKPSMVIPGKDAAQKATVAQVATETVNTLRRTVPPAVPGIVFLSGGQSEVLATQHLDAMNRLGPSPWPLSFSFGRALQESALKIWAGKSNMVSAGQEALHYRAECNSLARNGAYIGEAQRGADQGATH